MSSSLLVGDGASLFDKVQKCMDIIFRTFARLGLIVMWAEVAHQTIYFPPPRNSYQDHDAFALLSKSTGEW